MNTHNSLVDFFLAYTKFFLKSISTKLIEVVLFIYIVSLEIIKSILILSLPRRILIFTIDVGSYCIVFVSGY
jgi:hypothetical protein